MEAGTGGMQEGDCQFIPSQGLEGKVALLASGAGEEGGLWTMGRSVGKKLCPSHNRCNMHLSS